MRAARPTFFMILGAAIGALVGAPAPATMETMDGAAHVRVPLGPGTGVVATHDFSILVFVRPTETITGERAVFEIGGAVEVRIGADARPAARLRRASGSPTTIEMSAPTALAQGEWALIALSFTRSTGELWIGAATESAPFASASVTAPGFSPGPVSGDAYLGAAGGAPALRAVWGVVALRREAIAVVDGAAVWDSRRFHAPYDLDTTGAGGLMTGEANCWWMLNHSMSTLPTNGVFGSTTQGERAAVVGQALTTSNVSIYDRGSFFSPSNFSIVRPVTTTTGCVYVSHHEGANAGFFDRRMPETSGDFSEPRVAAPAPRARRLVTGAAGPWKVMFSGNSRSAKRFDGSGLSPGNFAHGFAWLDVATTSGVLNAPLTTSRTPWFGFDGSVNSPYATGGVTPIQALDFSRFWTGSVSGDSVGPGDGQLVPSGEQYVIRCRPEGLISAQAPLMMRAHALRYPGSSALAWAPNAHTRQGAPGTDAGAPTIVMLDTTAHEHIFQPSQGDANSGDTLTLLGDKRAFAPVGGAVAHGRSLAIIASVDFGQTAPGMTTIRLAHPFGQAPAQGAVIRFGPWAFETIEHLWPAVAQGDANEWRGMRFEGQPGGEGVVLFGVDAWRPDVDGFVWGVAGWGGNGYRPQIDESHPDVIRAWMQVFRPDVWLQTFAQQFSAPETMSEWRSMVKSALPYVDVVWLGDMTHTSTFTPWHEYILANGGVEGSPAVSLLTHPELGDQNELFADGLRADGNHISQRGNERLAALWLEALADAALPPVLPGDVNGDGIVEFADLNLVLSNYNATGSGVVGDVDFDNRVDFADLNLVLGSYGQTAPPP